MIAYLWIFTQKWSTIRDPSHKWHELQTDYPWNRYPEYMNGPTYLLSIEAIRAIVHRTRKFNILRLWRFDDHGRAVRSGWSVASRSGATFSHIWQLSTVREMFGWWRSIHYHTDHKCLAKCAGKLESTAQRWLRIMRQFMHGSNKLILFEVLRSNLLVVFHHKVVNFAVPKMFWHCMHKRFYFFCNNFLRFFNFIIYRTFLYAEGINR